MSQITAILQGLMNNWQQPSNPTLKEISDIMLYATPVLIPVIESSLPSVIGDKATYLTLFGYTIVVIVFKAIVKAFTVATPVNKP